MTRNYCFPEKTVRALLVMILLTALIAPNIPTLAGLLYWCGYDAQMDALETQGIDIVSHSRAAGWRNSTITTEFGYAGLEEAPTVKAVTEVQHGPLHANGQWLIARAETRLYVNNHPLTPDGLPPPIRTAISIGNHVVTLVDFTARTIPLDDGGELVFQGLEGLYDNQPTDHRDPFFRYAMKGMNLSTADLRIEIGESEGTIETKRSPAGNVLADHVFLLSDLRVSAPHERLLFSLSRLEMVSETDTVGDELVGSSLLRVDSVAIRGLEYGPLSVKALTEGWSDRATFEASQEWQRMQRRMRLMESEEIAPAMQQFWKTHGWPVLSGNPRFQLMPLSVVTDQGEISVSLKVFADGITKRDIPRHAWLKKLSADIQLQVPTAAIASIVYDRASRDLEQQARQEGWYAPEASARIQRAAESKSVNALESLRNSGFFVLSDDEDHFMLSLLLDDGKVLLNDNVFEPAHFLPALMSAGAYTGGIQ
jgi:hypothetical protein